VALLHQVNGSHHCRFRPSRLVCQDCWGRWARAQSEDSIDWICPLLGLGWWYQYRYCRKDHSSFEHGMAFDIDMDMGLLDADTQPDLTRYAHKTSDSYWQMLFVPLVYWSFSFIGIGKHFPLLHPKSRMLMGSGRICRSGNLRHPLLGSYSDHQPMG